jgi:hypothetical protein
MGLSVQIYADDVTTRYTYLQSWVPPQINQNDVIASSQVEPSTAGFEGDQDDACRLVFTNLI